MRPPTGAQAGSCAAASPWPPPERGGRLRQGGRVGRQPPSREPGRGEGEREERPESRQGAYRSDVTASTMCDADRPNFSTSSSGRPLRGSSRTAIWCTLPPIGATAFMTASPMPPAG